MTAINDSALSRAYNYDAGNRITSILDGSANINYSYEHDQLDRLLKQNLQDISLGYAYDANSNRTQSKVTKDSAVDVNNISYEAGSNRIIGVSYDASGRILNDGSRTYTYNPAGRIERIQNGAVGVFNVYNPIGQRIQKNSGSAKTYFSYDEQGLLIGEYDVNGKAIREYVYLGGQPIAMMTSERPDEVLQIHSDHLGTPRAVSNANNEILWRMEGDQFGDVQPSVEQVKLPLRHAGQYADDETGLFYNYYRFYDPKSGRYVTSDPIGLDGGMNTYGYVGGNALGLVDPYGLNPALGCAAGAWAGPIGCGVGAAIGLAINSLGIYILSEAINNSNDEISSIPEGETCPLNLPDKIPDFDFNDPRQTPIGADGQSWPWHGKPPQGGDKGGYKNPNGNESIHPDLDHPAPIGPHWDFNDRGKGNGYRIAPDGTINPK
ncbi:RHS repeat-associated core domain-containing protein [Psychrobacter pygoscelis]|uniref:RHS repeat-associated core domain-containing protein n=1 Tax=Psychrobacter pygoscelis TaxID=2488563 RepID=UPI001040BAA5|nr:RHS repeat-associated core domain-containing protein [Psychrobacter pygoscelis]